MIKINEIFYSIQGESTHAGRPTIFIRLTGCNLRCSYCDTEYAFFEGKNYKIEDILTEIKKYNCKLVEVTGGEPLLQKESAELISRLCDENYEVMVETGGGVDICNVDERAIVIMDIKCPSSGMSDKMLWENINLLKPIDEIKFVIADKNDFYWSEKIIDKFNLTDKFTVLFSPVFGKIEPVELVDLILEENLNVRFQLQMHKFVWKPDARGV